MTFVACVGGLVADVVGKPIEQMPSRGTLALVDRMELHTGGCAANTAVALAKLGVPTYLIGKVGKDGFGDFLIQKMRQQGVNAEGVVRDDTASTSATMVMVHTDGERTFLHHLGANATLTLQDISLHNIYQARILHIAGAFLVPALDGPPTAQLLAEAKQHGVITCMDTAWDASGKWMQTLGPCLPFLDYFVPSLVEAEHLSGRRAPAEMARLFQKLGAGVVVIKMGQEGCFVRTTAGEEWFQPALPVPMIDALGAGDAWSAGLLAGIMEDLPLRDAVQLANGTGAACVTALGATTGIHSRAAVEELVSRYESREA